MATSLEHLSKPYTLPSVSTIPKLSVEEQVLILDALFEPCNALHALSLNLLHTTTFGSYSELIAAIRKQFTELKDSDKKDDIRLLDIILGAHPRLGASKVTSTQSEGEQRQLNTGGEEQAQKLRRLNEEYEQAFPGLIYVVFVNGRDRPTIMENMRSRIERGDINLERGEAIEAMCEIAEDRSKKLQT